MKPNKHSGFGWQIVFIIFLIFVCILSSGCISGQQEEKVYRVGILCGLDPLTGIVDSFKAQMTELGYMEGKNISYDAQKTNFEPDKEQQILKKFVDDKIDLIFTFPTEVSLAAKAATQGTDIPVVFSYATIEGNNLVESVRQPGGDITGVREPGPDIFVRRLEILNELAPRAKRIYITYSPNVPFIPPVLDALHKASSLMNITLVENSVTSVEEIKADLQARNKSGDIGIDAILIMGEPLSVSPPALEAMIKFAAEHKIPIGGIGSYTIRESIIFGYEITIDDMGKLAASQADKVLKGTPAGTIPVITPGAKSLINYKLAQELGLNVSEGLLARADEIIR
ncbi:MAG: ABC transporter substrate-binding protein [Candidatus Aenigmarchaeota archaeon]|nr:ABC transporter substrate-binding protein [Candidatus Aenigmarchaeota archaeon]